MRADLTRMAWAAGMLWAICAQAESPGAIKARIGYSPLAEVTTLEADGLGSATDPVHLGLGGYYSVNPHVQLGLSLGWGRYLNQQSDDSTTHLLTVLPTVRLLPSDRTGLSLYAEAALGYGFARQSLTDRSVSSHGWQAQAEGGMAWAIADQLQLELGVTVAFKVGSDAVPEDRLAPLTVGFSAPDVWLGLAYSL